MSRGEPHDAKQAKAWRTCQIQHDADDIDDAPSVEEAQSRLEAFMGCWSRMIVMAGLGKRKFKFARRARKQFSIGG